MESAIYHKLRVEIPGKTAELYRPGMTEYMREPTDCLTSRRYTKVYFAGPAQSGKTFALVELFIAYCALSDPMDAMIVEKDRISARAFVKGKIDRLIAANPQLQNELASAQADGVIDKMFRSGIQIAVGWPSSKQLAGRSIGRIIITDLDRSPGDIGKEGSMPAQASQRIRTFGSRGMLVVESSPSATVTDPSWQPPDGNRHIAPPTEGGIWSLYNTGDRRRLYGRCPHCGEYMLPLDTPDAFDLTKDRTPALVCTANGCLIAEGAEEERAFKSSTVWAGEGQEIDHKAGKAVGDRIDTDTASFWMHGAFAGYQNWRGLIKNYQSAMREYEATGMELTLKNVLNAEWCVAYIPVAARYAESAHSAFMDRAEDMEPYIVPEWARVLIATVDVQLNRFEAMVTAIGPGYEIAIISRFAIRRSKARGGQPIAPAQYLEDWDALTDKLVNSTYKVEGSEHELRILRTGVDMQGVHGVTPTALNWWRGLDRRKEGGQNLRARVMLMRGNPSVGPGGKLITKTFPDAAATKGKINATRGDVPIYQTNVNALKDMIWADIHREEPGPRYVHFPKFLKEYHFKELTAEVRNPKTGKWDKIGGRNNETFDLLYMTRAIWIQLGGDKINWDNPPGWACDILNNTERFGAAERRQMKSKRRRKGSDEHEGFF
jgi:phage terminase large subunit GpA-like protein